MCARGVLFAVGLSVTGAGCGGDRNPATDRFEPLVAFDTIAAAIVVVDTTRAPSEEETIRLTVELADTDDRRAYGMMERPELPRRHGMLFVYPTAQDPATPFWMYRTEIPLDIAFLDGGGRIVAIRSMEPCRSPNPDLCRRYAPGVAYRGALEVGRGLFAEWGVEPGDRVVPAPDSLAPSTEPNGRSG